MLGHSQSFPLPLLTWRLTWCSEAWSWRGPWNQYIDLIGNVWPNWVLPSRGVTVDCEIHPPSLPCGGKVMWNAWTPGHCSALEAQPNSSMVDVSHISAGCPETAFVSFQFSFCKIPVYLFVWSRSKWAKTVNVRTVCLVMSFCVHVQKTPGQG